MGQPQYVMVYATGRDQALSEMSWSLFEAGLILRSDMLERWPHFLNEKRKGKVGGMTKCVVLLCEGDKLDEVMGAMPSAYPGEGLLALALPVIGLTST